MAKLAPSLLSADFYNLENQIKILEKNKIEYLHLDCMDGTFVPNISFGPLVIKKLRSKTDMIFDTHLMIENPERYIEDFHNSGSDIITIHFEATKHPHRVIQKIKARHARPHHRWCRLHWRQLRPPDASPLPRRHRHGPGQAHLRR